MQLTLDSILTQADAWAAAKVALPKFDIAAVRAQTKATPEWVHFGAGNIFRGFMGSLNQRLLNAGETKTGIITEKRIYLSAISPVTLMRRARQANRYVREAVRIDRS